MNQRTKLHIETPMTDCFCEYHKSAMPTQPSHTPTLEMGDPDGDVYTIQTTAGKRYAECFSMETVEAIVRAGNSHAALQAENRELLEALQALGTYPGGYCFCPEGRDAGEVNAFGNAHTGECEDARKAIANAEAK